MAEAVAAGERGLMAEIVETEDAAKAVEDMESLTQHGQVARALHQKYGKTEAIDYTDIVSVASNSGIGGDSNPNDKRRKVEDPTRFVWLCCGWGGRRWWLRCSGSGVAALHLTRGEGCEGKLVAAPSLKREPEWAC
jgi:hypothetical protein